MHSLDSKDVPKWLINSEFCAAANRIIKHISTHRSIKRDRSSYEFSASTKPLPLTEQQGALSPTVKKEEAYILITDYFDQNLTFTAQIFQIV